MEATSENFEAAEKVPSGTPSRPEAPFRADLRPDFQWPRIEVVGTEGNGRRRSIERSKEETEFWAVATPL